MKKILILVAMSLIVFGSMAQQTINPKNFQFVVERVKEVNDPQKRINEINEFISKNYGQSPQLNYTYLSKYSAWKAEMEQNIPVDKMKSVSPISKDQTLRIQSFKKTIEGSKDPSQFRRNIARLKAEIKQDNKSSETDKALYLTFVETVEVATMLEYNKQQQQSNDGNKSAKVSGCGVSGSICVGICTGLWATVGFVGAGPWGAMAAGTWGFFFCKWCVCCPWTRPKNVGCP